MGSARKILEEMKWGISPEVLAKKHSWEELSAQDYQDLFNFTRFQRDSQQSYNLLVFLFRISRDKDLWYSVEVLSQALLHPAMTSEDRNTILHTLRNRLNRIKDEVTARQPTKEKVRKYWLLEASYYSIYGAALAETSRNLEAVQNYQIAEGIFEQLGLNQEAENYKQKIELLLEVETKPKSTPELPSGGPPAKSLPSGSPPPPAKSLPSGSPPPSANFRVTMEQVAAAQMPPIHEPATSLKSLQVIEPPQPEAQENALASQTKGVTSEKLNPPPALRPAPKKPAIEATLPDLAGKPPVVPPETTPLASSKPVIEEERPPVLPKDLPNTRYLNEPANEAAILASNIPFESILNQESSAVPLEMPVSPSEKNEDQVHLANEIQEQGEILTEIQLDNHMYLERRSLLFREVQNLEKKVASLKELCDRLERKSKKLDQNT